VKNMKRGVFGVCVVALTAVVVSAQDKNVSMKATDMAMEKTYSGCLERSDGDSYILTHLMVVNTKKPIKKDDAMAKAAMAKDAMVTMAPASLTVAGGGKDLGKYVAHTVTVTGTNGDAMNGMGTFNVKSFKSTGASCSGKER
jgi:hypothetical protein